MGEYAKAAMKIRLRCQRGLERAARMEEEGRAMSRGGLKRRFISTSGALCPVLDGRGCGSTGARAQRRPRLGGQWWNMAR